jgi:ABC-type transporter Mla subunit MlaD
MWIYFKNFGIGAKDLVLDLSSLLTEDFTPGIVSVLFFIVLVGSIILYVKKIHQINEAIKWAKSKIVLNKNGSEFSDNLTDINLELSESTGSQLKNKMKIVWDEYRKTFVHHSENDRVIIRNSVRPSTYFNTEDLGFSAGFWKILPGLFVTAGLFFTFLGLISALGSMDFSPGKADAALSNLLKIASAKFIMSLSGLFCSIAFTIALRNGISTVENGLHDLCETIESRLSFISLENLAVEQLAAIREQREHFRLLGYELVAELGRPLREELPAAISASIKEAISPILEQVGKAGTEGLDEMVKDLSTRFSADVGQAMSQVSDQLKQAGEQISRLSDRMDQSSDKMGNEMDAAVARLAQAVDDLRNTMGQTAETAGGALNKGAEQLLTIMNQTLEGIRDNTSEGARAMTEAASDMRAAAEGFRTELEAATKSSAESVQQRMSEAGADASGAISEAGKGVLDSFSRTSGDIVRVSEELSAKVSNDLLSPLAQIGSQIEAMAESIKRSNSEMKKLSDGVRAGAEASERASVSFQSSSDALVQAANPIRATTERIETAVRQLNESTQNVATTIVRSAESTSKNSAQTLATAQEVLAGHAKAIESSLAGVSEMLRRLENQGEALDDIDEKLGAAFDNYVAHVESAVNSMQQHVIKMNNDLAPALDTLRAIVDQAEQFSPESRRR